MRQHGKGLDKQREMKGKGKNNGCKPLFSIALRVLRRLLLNKKEVPMAKIDFFFLVVSEQLNLGFDL